MKVNLTTKKSAKGKYLGYCNFNDDILIESGDSIDEVARRMKKLIHELHGAGISPVEFLIETESVTKAKNMILKLKGQKDTAKTTVTFDTSYFK